MNKKRRKVLPTPQGNRTGPRPSPRPQVSEQDKIIALPEKYEFNWLQRLSYPEFERYMALNNKAVITRNRGLSSAEQSEFSALLSKAKMPRQEALTRGAQFKVAAARHFEKPYLAKLTLGDRELFENFQLLFTNWLLAAYAGDYASVVAHKKQLLPDDLLNATEDVMTEWQKGPSQIEAWLQRSFIEALEVTKLLD